MIRLPITIFIAAALALCPAIASAQAVIPPVEMAKPGDHGFRIDKAGVLGNYLPAAGTGRHPAILLLGGSEGGLSNAVLRMAERLQAAGFSVLQQSYYRGPGEPQNFSRIPLETFDRGLAWLKARTDVDPDRIGIVGASKGAEAALITAARHPEIKAVVAGMPSAYMWPAFSLTGAHVSGPSWTLNGKDEPALPYGAFDPKNGIGSVYFNGIKHATNYPAAAIDIAKSPAPILLVCGKADRLWPSCPMAQTLKAEDPRVTVLSYSDAGHGAFGVPTASDSAFTPMLKMLGGTAKGNNDARKDSWPKTIEFLKTNLE